MSRDMSRATASRLVAVLVAALALAGCARTLGNEDFPSDPPPERPGTAAGGPPPVTLHRSEGDVDLDAFTWCYQDEVTGTGGCADGMPPAHPPETSDDSPLTFTFPLRGWSFAATFRRPGLYRDCERLLTMRLEQADDGSYEVPALAPAGTWDVDLGGNGPSGGDLYTTFRWTTSGDPVVTPATGDVGLLGPPSVYEDKDLEAYGPSLFLTGLGTEPATATAELVLSDAGASATYPMRLPRKENECPDDGVVSFEGTHGYDALELPDLGEPPYTYEVHLTMDGEAYVGTGSWPDDLWPRNSNQLRLTWTPPLPAWDGR